MSLSWNPSISRSACYTKAIYILIEGEENILLSKIQKSRDLDESVVKAVEELLQNIYDLMNGLKNKALFYIEEKCRYRKTTNLE